MKALMAVLDLVAWATLASMTRLTRALLSLSWAWVRDRVRRAIASPRPGASGMCCDLVREATGAWGGALVGSTLGAAAGIVEGTTLGDVAGLLLGATLGAEVGLLDGCICWIGCTFGVVAGTVGGGVASGLGGWK